MPDPYRTILISVAASVLFLAGTAVYRFLYPKRRINLLLLLLLISAIATFSLFRPGSFESGDFLVHTYRSIAFYDSLAEGHLVPSWAGDLNANYGYPLFIFNYPLPYYLISLFHFVGFSFITSMKLFLFLCFLGSGLFMYYAARTVIKNDSAAVTAAVFYQFAPYHLIDVHFRAGVGEVLFFTALPLAWMAFHRLWERRDVTSLLLTSLTVALLINTHALLAPIFMLLFFLYTVFRALRSRLPYLVIVTGLSLLIGSLCSLYILLTPMVLSQYTILAKAPPPVLNLPDPWQLLFAPWAWGLLFQGHYGELSYLLGYTHIIVAVTVGVLVVRKRLSGMLKLDALFWLSVCLMAAFFTTSLSQPLWESVPFVTNLATSSQRWLVVIAFGTSILAGILALHLRKRPVLLTVLLFMTVFSTILNWGHRRMQAKMDDWTYERTLWAATAGVEGHWFAMSKWRSYEDIYFRQRPQAPLAFAQGQGEFREVNRTSTAHTYVVSARTPARLRDNTMYFPGWQSFVNGAEVPVSPDEEGVITFSLPKGLHYVEVRYQDVPEYNALKTISFVTLLIALLSWLRMRRVGARALDKSR